MSESDPEPRRIRIDLAYDGTEFAGFQLQPNRRTVQGTLEAELSKLAHGRPVRVRAASRTDAGVHARAQVVDCRIGTRLDDRGIELALDRLLPHDLRPIAVRTVADPFHAQLDATSKTYVYRIDRTAHGDPLRARFALHVPGPLDAASIDRGLAFVRGRHDFSGFADSRCRVRDRVRELVEARYTDGPVDGTFTFRANGFLTYMVRNLVGTLLEVGRGRRSARDMAEILDRRDRTLASASAPPCGLTLWRVTYPEEPLVDGRTPVDRPDDRY